MKEIQGLWWREKGKCCCLWHNILQYRLHTGINWGPLDNIDAWIQSPEV